MSRAFTEGKLQFTFDGDWQVVKYDDHVAYRKGIAELINSKAVDFVAVHGQDELYLIEVKDFRGYRIENRSRTRDGKLAIEVAEKVRDSIAGVFGAHRRRALDEPAIARAFVETLDPERRIKVVLWLEEDRPRDRDIRAAGRQSILLRELKKRLRWLNARILIESIADSSMPGTKVKNLAGAGQGG